MRAILLTALAALLASLAYPAQAQSEFVVQLQRKIVAERRLADDREIKLLREQEALRKDLQQRLSLARTKGAAAKNEVSSLSRELRAAEGRENALLEQILDRDPASKILTADLESELSQLSVSTAPKLRAAIERFGEGKRADAWPQIEALTRNGNAREKRIAARLRLLMFNYQDPGVTAEDTRGRWAAAVAADPQNSLALLFLGIAEAYIGDIEKAMETYGRAAAVAKTAQERYLITWHRTAAAYRLQKPDVMVTLLREQLEAVKALSPGGSGDANRLWMEAQTNIALAGFLMNVGKNAEAATVYQQAAELFERVQRNAPTWRYIEDALAQTQVALAAVQIQQNKLVEAAESYGKATKVLEERIQRSPMDAAEARQMLIQTHIGACNLELQRNALAQALSLCSKALNNRKEQPKSAARDYLLAAETAFVGRLLLSNGKRDEAAATFRESAGRWRELVVVDPVPAILLGYADALHMVAELDPLICWRDVAAAWKAYSDTTPLNQLQERVARRARINGRAGLGCDLIPPTSPSDQSQRSTNG